MDGLLVRSVRLSASGPVDLATAWERYDQLALWPTWSPQLRRVDADAERLAPGVRGRVVGPLSVRAAFEIIAVDRASRRWSWVVRSGPVSMLLEHGVDAGSDGRGSSTWLVVRGPAPIVLGYAPIAWYALHRLVTMQTPPRS